MKRIFVILFFIALVPIAINAQDEEKYNYGFTLGVSGGLDYNINAYRMNPNKEGNTFSKSTYRGISDFNFGIDYGQMIGKRFRPRFEAKYVQMSYDVSWDGANMVELTKSIVDLFNFDFNLHFDYLVYNKQKLQVFVSPAIKWEFNMSRIEKNIRDRATYGGDHHSWYQYNDIIDENSRNLMAGAMSAIFKYNVSRKVGIVVVPEYTMFFRNFVRTNTEPYSRFSVNAGVEFNFY